MHSVSRQAATGGPNQGFAPDGNVRSGIWNGTRSVALARAMRLAWKERRTARPKQRSLVIEGSGQRIFGKLADADCSFTPADRAGQCELNCKNRHPPIQTPDACVIK